MNAIPVAREGLPFILAFLAAALLAALWARGGGWGVRTALPATLFVLTLFVVYFFRDPERSVPPDPDIVASPADGTIMSVAEVAGEAVGEAFGEASGEVFGEAFMGATATRVTIFLSIFNVHVQRAPLAGRVDAYAYRPGRYLPAWREEAGSENEQASLGLTTADGPVVVRQVAGLVARRIVTYPREGDGVAKGERIGLIRFGSRVDLFLPACWEVLVGAGDKVRGGETPVARIDRSRERS